MDISDDGKKKSFDNSSGGKCILENVEENIAAENVVDSSFPIDPGTSENEFSITETLHASDDGYWAELQVRYSWNGHGTSFNCTAVQYRAKDNGRREGNVILMFYSSTSDYWISELTGSAKQDGEWHSISGGATVAGNSKDATISFTYIYDRNNTSDPKLRKSISVTYQPPTPAFAQNKHFTASTFDVTGTGGLAFSVMVLDDGAGTLATRLQPIGETWSVPVTVADHVNAQRMQAYQQFNGRNSPRTPFKYMYRAKLTYPTAGAIVPMKDLVYQAIGAPDSKMFALNSTNIYESWSDQHPVNSSGVWQGASIRVLPSGDAEVKVRFYDNPDVSASYDYTRSVAFKVLGYPLITLPTADSLQNSNFDLSGDNGLAQSRIVAYYDLTGTAVGENIVRPNGTWSIPVAVRAGLVSLAVEQFAGGKSSGRGALRTFKIKPPQPPKLTEQVDDQGNLTLGGDGYIGAKFDLHFEGQMTPFHSFIVTTSPWAVHFSGWVPGTVLVGGRQSMPDSAGQPIYSDWAPASTRVVIPVPLPTLSCRVGPDGIPTFFGMGKKWPDLPASLVEVRLNNAYSAIVPIVAVEADSTWSSTATARWAPGTYQVTARMQFLALQSGWVQPPVSVVIPAPLAEIKEVILNGLFATVVGQCWPGAELTIKFDDNSTPHRVTDTDKDRQWDFQRPTAFRPGRHTVRVTQTFGGQTSNEVSMAFEIVVSVLVITPPPGGETDHLPVLHGTGGIDGFTISVYDFLTHDLLGEALATGDAWSVPIKELDYLTHTVFAIQVLDDLQSVPSTSVTFKVVLFAPTIDFPETETSVPRTFAVEGYARAGKGFDRPEVDVYLNDVPHRVYPHFGDGYFKQYFTRPLGPCVLKAKQYFKDQVSPFTQDVKITIVPDKPLIETPASGEAVGQHALICGFGYAKDEVVVALPDGMELGRTEVQADGTWFCRIEIPEGGTDLSLVTEQRNGEYRSGWSEPRSVQRLAAPPTFDEPPEGNWEPTTPGFAGVALPESRVEVVAWHNSDEIYAKGLVTIGGRWAGASEGHLPAGPQWARAVQVVGGKRSMPADSKRFEIAPSDEPPQRHPNP